MNVAFLFLKPFHLLPLPMRLFLSVVRLQDYAKNTESISMLYCGRVVLDPRKNPLNVGADLYDWVDSGIVWFFYFLYIAR